MTLERDAEILVELSLAALERAGETVVYSEEDEGLLIIQLIGITFLSGGAKMCMYNLIADVLCKKYEGEVIYNEVQDAISAAADVVQSKHSINTNNLKQDTNMNEKLQTAMDLVSEINAYVSDGSWSIRVGKSITLGYKEACFRTSKTYDQLDSLINDLQYLAWQAELTLLNEKRCKEHSSKQPINNV